MGAGFLIWNMVCLHRWMPDSHNAKLLRERRRIEACAFTNFDRSAHRLNPFRLRLGIVVLAYLLCLALFGLVFLPSHNGSILAIPLALSSWMFKRRGALIGLGCTLLALIVFNSLSVGGIVWPLRWL